MQNNNLLQAARGQLYPRKISDESPNCGEAMGLADGIIAVRMSKREWRVYYDSSIFVLRDSGDAKRQVSNMRLGNLSEGTSWFEFAPGTPVVNFQEAKRFCIPLLNGALEPRPFYVFPKKIQQNKKEEKPAGLL